MFVIHDHTYICIIGTLADEKRYTDLLSEYMDEQRAMKRSKPDTPQLRSNNSLFGKDKNEVLVCYYT